MAWGRRERGKRHGEKEKRPYVTFFVFSLSTGKNRFRCFAFQLICPITSGIQEEDDKLRVIRRRSPNPKFFLISGVDFKIKHLMVGGKKLKLTIWDTAGQERFRTITSSYYRNAQGIFLVYDVTRRETFTNLSEIWAKEIELYSTNQDCIKMLVGNKVDKESDRVVTKEEGIAFAQEYGCLFLECSAKTRANVEKCFEELAQKILEVPSLLEEGSAIGKKNILKQRQESQKNMGSSGSVNAITFTITNNCEFTVWPATLSGGGHPLLDTTGFTLDPGSTVYLPAPPTWSGRLWARTHCSTDPTGRFSCLSGDCASGSISCSGAGGIPPATLAEFTLDGADGNDFYDTSLVDGFNLPLSIVPDVAGCSATGCASDVNQLCPVELQQTADDGEVIGCKSPCLVFQTDQYCCTGAYSDPHTCTATDYSRVFKDACPRAYSYPYDDPTSTFTCVGANYLITFCPVDGI
ncbi:Ras-related protein RABC2a [Dendrobium catenatum]|uniref:Ras-related protein RABC2a n=1 Tax=Dendrobium catenatum TaxID=906689 RepID=A0A2I0X675_9ASPA|nr:Ras-related protein RABC2a [Dendrobium catenatum]